MTGSRPVVPEEAYRFNEWCYAMDLLERITAYITGEFRMTMCRDDAKANLDARALLLRHRMRMADEFATWMLQTFYPAN